MKATAFAVLLSLVITPPAQGGTSRFGLPASALILETRAVKSDRALILWMLRPSKHPREMSPDEPYTCPEETRGSYYAGHTRVSLVHTKTRKIINTLRIRQEYNEGADEFDVPYQIRRNSYYHVEGAREGREGKPTIMWLRDYNGDGKAQEFALFDALACMGLQTTLIGYSERQDRVIQYPIHVVVMDRGKRSVEVRHWVDYLFSRGPESPGRWEYEIDYRGRGGLLDRYEIRYNKRAERFEGKIEYTEG
ncbi:MAG TPA: hypothetical protein VIQ24_16295 [Pyrinomonadaceae bacterium]